MQDLTPNEVGCSLHSPYPRSAHENASHIGHGPEGVLQASGAGRGRGRHAVRRRRRRPGQRGDPPAVREGEAVAHRVQLLASPHDVQDDGRARPEPGNRRHAEEVRGDHDARFPPVDQGHLPRRLPPRSVVGRLRRRHRPVAVHGDEDRARRQGVQPVPLGPVGPVFEEMARAAGRQHREDRHGLPAHLQQRAPEPRRPQRRAAQGGHPRRRRSGWTRPRMLGTKTMRANTGVSGHADHARGRAARDGLPEERQDRRLPRRSASSRSRSWRTTARRSASRSPSRTTGASAPTR